MHTNQISRVCNRSLQKYFGGTKLYRSHTHAHILGKKKNRALQKKIPVAIETFKNVFLLWKKKKCLPYTHTQSWIKCKHTQSWVKKLSCLDCKRAHHVQHTATHGNTRQHTATHCNTLQHTLMPRLFRNRDIWVLKIRVCCTMRNSKIRVCCTMSYEEQRVLAEMFRLLLGGYD